MSLEKQPVVYEEVGVGTRPVTETQRVGGTVRREEAHMERGATSTPPETS